MNVECFYIHIYLQQQSLPITVFRDVLVESIRIAGWLLFPIILIILIIAAFLLLET